MFPDGLVVPVVEDVCHLIRVVYQRQTPECEYCMVSVLQASVLQYLPLRYRPVAVVVSVVVVVVVVEVFAVVVEVLLVLLEIVVGFDYH